MTMNNIIAHIKSAYHRFQSWQKCPVHFENKNTHTTTCACCGTVFSDNYCPRCGQKATTQRITWESVRQGIMMLWGFDARSFPLTLVQLLLRPGYLISDYLAGKRQVAFPPVKGLFIFAVFYLILKNLWQTYFGYQPVYSAESDDFINRFLAWSDNNPAWGELVTGAFLLLPTWLFFRFSPRHSRHTLPEGFFLQVFMSTISLMLSALTIMGPSTFDTFAIPTYYLIAYKQLFGYGWWGTLWRLTFCFVIELLSIALIYALYPMVSEGLLTGKRIIAIITATLFVAALILMTLGFGYYVSKKVSKR